MLGTGSDLLHPHHQLHIHIAILIHHHHQNCKNLGLQHIKILVQRISEILVFYEA